MAGRWLRKHSLPPVRTMPLAPLRDESFVRGPTGRLRRGRVLHRLRHRVLLASETGVKCTTARPRVQAGGRGRTVPPSRPRVVVEPVVFAGPGSGGDFRSIMRDFERMKSTLLVFNGNVEQDYDPYYRPLHAGPREEGGGNACARILACAGLSVGIPTGCFRWGGFKSLHAEISRGSEPPTTAKRIIDDMLKELERVVALRLTTGNPANGTALDKMGIPLALVYSADPVDGCTLGTGIFHVGDDVKQYITDGIYRVASAFN